MRDKSEGPAYDAPGHHVASFSRPYSSLPIYANSLWALDDKSLPGIPQVKKMPPHRDELPVTAGNQADATCMFKLLL